MSYFTDKNNIKESTKGVIVGIGTDDARAKIIAKALNYYFGETFSKNAAVEMMNRNTSNSLKMIIETAKRNKMNLDTLLDFLFEASEELAAQAMVVSMRDELKFEKPTNRMED